MLLPLAAAAQGTRLEKAVSLEVSGSSISVDQLGYVYLISESILKKFDDKGTLLFSYTELRDGKVQSADVSDPLKIMIFNPDFGKIKYLDNKLSLKKDFIALADLGYPNATLVSASYDNGFWLYDPLTSQVIRFDYSLKQSHASGNISDITGHEISPVYMVEVDNDLYLYDPQNGILVFDRYGTYLRLLPFKNLKSFQIILQQVVFSEGNKLKKYNLKTYEEAELEIPGSEEIKSALLCNDKVFVLTDKHLDIYNIK